MRSMYRAFAFHAANDVPVDHLKMGHWQKRAAIVHIDTHVLGHCIGAEAV